MANYYTGLFGNLFLGYRNRFRFDSYKNICNLGEINVKNYGF